MLFCTLLHCTARFDRMLYLSVSETAEAQTNIIRALTRKFHLDPCLDLEQVVSHCPYTYTGADFYALCSDAMLEAMGRKARDVEKSISQYTAFLSPHSYDFCQQRNSRQFTQVIPTHK